VRATLWAEHGFWHRSIAAPAWRGAAHISRDWIDRVRPILEQFTASTLGSHIEEKSASLAWHYRGAQRDFGARQAHELRMLLGDALSNQPLEVLEGKKVIEIRLRGVSKALVAHRVMAEIQPGVEVIAIGDDRTNEDLFRALPRSTLTVAVGPGPTHARYRLGDCRAVRRLLRTLVDAAESANGHADAPPERLLT
jgi:trehalose 6-phosphate synthase/phosphatase